MTARVIGATARFSVTAFIASACAGTPSGGSNSNSSSGGGSNSVGGNSSGGSGGSSGGSGGGSSSNSSSGGGSGGSSSSGGGGGSSSGAGATIVPLYSYPTEAPWSAIVTAKLAHPSVPVIAIVNVNNGPATAVDAAFTSGIRSLTGAGIVVIGYVYTSYGARAATTVKADIDAWHKFYAGVTGIFFDEESNTSGGDAYYRDLATYAKANGMALTVANPGTDTSSAYTNAMDVTFIYETDGLPTSSLLTGWRSRYTRAKVGVIPYAVNFDLAWVQQARSAVGYIYVTNDDLPNPWDTLPNYFSSLLAALE